MSKNILQPGYLKFDGKKYTTDEDIEIQGPPGPTGPSVPGPPGQTGPRGEQGDQGEAGITLPYAVNFLSYDFTTNSNVFVRAGTRELDLTNFPATLGGKTRTVKFIATFETSVSSATADIRLFDYTHNTLVTGTNTSTTSDSTYLFVSSNLTVGSSAGNIRSDVTTIYEVQLKMTVGNVSTDRVICSGARLEIIYV